MSLKFVVDSVDGLSADMAALYSKNADGKFYLEVEGAVSKTKLDEFRDNNVRVLKELEKFKGIDPTKYADLLALQAKADEKKLIDAGELDKVVEQRVGQMRTTYDTEIEKLTRANTSAQRQLESLLIDSAVRDAAIKSGVQPTAIEDVLLRAKSTFQIKEGAPVPIDSAGVTIYGKDGSTPMTIADWTVGLKKQAPHLFQGSTGGGAGGSGKLSMDATSKMSPNQKITAGLDGLL
jgi:hypothetical protein